MQIIPFQLEKCPGQLATSTEPETTTTTTQASITTMAPLVCHPDFDTISEIIGLCVFNVGPSTEMSSGASCSDFGLRLIQNKNQEVSALSMTFGYKTQTISYFLSPQKSIYILSGNLCNGTNDKKI